MKRDKTWLQKAQNYNMSTTADLTMSGKTGDILKYMPVKLVTLREIFFNSCV